LAQLQRALAEMGAIDTIVFLISLAHKYEALSSYQRDIAQKVVELAYELVHYGPTDLQNMFVSLIEEKRLGLSASKNFMSSIKVQLKVFGAEVKRALEHSVLKEAKQEEKRNQRLDTILSRSSTLLLFLKMLCENHNARVQEYLRHQSAYRNINLVTLTVSFLSDVVEPLPESLVYIKDSTVVKAFLTSGGGRHCIGESVAAIGGLNKVKLIAWWNYAPSELTQFTKQFTLLAQAFATLTEFVQGPVVANQQAMAQARVAELMVPMFEFLLALQLEGRVSGRKSLWHGYKARSLVHLLVDSSGKTSSLQESTAERDGATAWLDKFVRGGAALKESWDAEESRMLSAARAMELKMVELLTSMLEGETDVNVADHVLNVLDGPVMLALLNIHWQKQLSIKKKSRVQSEMQWSVQKREETNLAFQYFSLIDILTDDTLLTPAAMPLRKLFQRWLAAEGKEIIGSIRSIEILDGKGDLGRVHFKMPEFVQLVWGEDDVEEKKQEILQQVKRDNPEEKLKDFWLRTDGLIAVLRHQFRLRKLPHKLRRRFGILGYVVGNFIQGLARGHLVLYWISMIAACVLNFVMLFTIDSEDVDKKHSIEKSPELGVPAIILFVSMTLETIAHFIAHVVLLVRSSLADMHARGGVPYVLPFISHTKTKSTQVNSPVKVKFKAMLRGEEIVIRPLEFNYVLYLLFSDPQTLKYAFFMVTASLTVFYSYYFSCVHLLNIMSRVPTMRYVAQVLQKNLVQMVTTLILVFILIYNFSVFAYAVPLFRNDQAILDLKADALGISSLLLNTIFYWDYGFREAPVFGNTFLQNETTLPLSEGSDASYGYIVLGFVFDFLYHTSVILIFSAVVSGIIIDAFAELRAKNNIILDENANTCFICDIDREDFEQVGLNFKAHIKEDHNMWDYVFFRFYLEAKDPTEFTGLETYCSKLIKEQKINWLPIKKAIVIEGRNKEKKDVPGVFRRLDLLERQNDSASREIAGMRSEVDQILKATEDIRALVAKLSLDK